MNDFEEYNMGAYIAALKTRAEKAERERNELREALRKVYECCDLCKEGLEIAKNALNKTGRT